jgi:hypothetical protein
MGHKIHAYSDRRMEKIPYEGPHSFQFVSNLVARIKENYKGRTGGAYGTQNTCIQ